MNILYYTWDEITASDCISCMKDLGHALTVIDTPIANYTSDPSFENMLSDTLCKEHNFDCVFTFNYIPIISKVCNDVSIPYISWVFDSPHMTLESKTITNPCNRIYLFDLFLYETLKGRGITTVNYMPLGYYGKRIHSLTSALPNPYNQFNHEISFVGTLYNDNYNFYDQIPNIPDYLKGYIDGIIESQLDLYGCDLITPLFDHSLCNELSKYANISLSDNYFDCHDELLRNMLRRKATITERPRLLSLLGHNFNVDHFAGAPADKDINVTYCGYAENHIQMPTIFHTSKINLNITLRSIQSGLPLRIIDILGAGGFLLTNYQLELPEYFENNVDLVWFESKEDMLEKAAFYLAPENETKRIQIAQNGHKKAAELFTYEHLLPLVLKL